MKQCKDVRTLYINALFPTFYIIIVLQFSSVPFLAQVHTKLSSTIFS